MPNEFYPLAERPFAFSRRDLARLAGTLAAGAAAGGTAAPLRAQEQHTGEHHEQERGTGGDALREAGRACLRGDGELALAAGE